MYKVIKMFHDMQDNNYLYEAGAEYPREGTTVLPSRVKELSTGNNRIGEPLIMKVEEEKPKGKSGREK